MRMRLGLLTGIGVGYVVGTAAGRERYEQLRDAGQRLLGSDSVQQLQSRVRSVTGGSGSSSTSGSPGDDTGIEDHTGPPPNLPEGTLPRD